MQSIMHYVFHSWLTYHLQSVVSKQTTLWSSLSQTAFGQKKGMWVSVKPGGIQTFQAEAEQIDELFASITFAYRRSSVLFSLVAQLTN